MKKVAMPSRYLFLFFAALCFSSQGFTQENFQERLNLIRANAKASTLDHKTKHRGCELSCLTRDMSNGWAGLSLNTKLNFSNAFLRPTDNTWSLLGAGFVYTGTHKTYNSGGSNFIIHYETGGTHDPSATDANTNGVPDYVETVHNAYVTQSAAMVAMGYPTPPNDGTANDFGQAGNPDTKFDVFLLNLASLGALGFNVSIPETGAGKSVSSFMAIHTGLAASGSNGIGETVAHEYHHAIQNGMARYADSWYFEATSTWIEGVLFVTNPYPYQQAATYLGSPQTSMNLIGSGYPANIFNQYMEEKISASTILNIWTQLGNDTTSTNKSVFASINTVLGNTGRSLPNAFQEFSQWNLDKGKYTRNSASLASLTVTSSITPTSDTTVGVTVNHMASYYIKFIPTTSSSNLFIAMNGPSTSTRASLMVESTTNTFTTTSLSLDGNNDVQTSVSNFNSANITAAYLVLNNTETSTDGARFAIAYSLGSSPSIPASNDATTLTTTGGGGGGGGGCFIQLLNK